MNYRSMLALIVVGALATGCDTNSAQTGDASAEKVKYEVIATGDTEDRIDVLSVVAGKSGDLMKASVSVQNDSNFNYTFEYRFKWYDAAGAEINPDSTAWMPIAIMAKEMKSLQALAPNPAAATFKLFLQEKQ